MLSGNVKYKCTKCHAVKDADSWNHQTIHALQDEDITPIEEINFANHKKDIHVFDCPSCQQTCEVDKGDIEEVKE